MTEIEDKVKELEALFIWGKITFSPYVNSTLADVHIHLASALFRQDLTVTAVRPLPWLQEEIDRRKAKHPEAYWVHCYRCGHVQIGYDEYDRQMNKEDSLWKCPKCGNLADFDVTAYEKVFYPDEVCHE
jgi:predicted RNA-binding Zn-ribbon protein involved in translation (DUF1610 family)